MLEKKTTLDCRTIISVMSCNDSTGIEMKRRAEVSEKRRPDPPGVGMGANGNGVETRNQEPDTPRDVVSTFEPKLEGQRRTFGLPVVAKKQTKKTPNIR